MKITYDQRVKWRIIHLHSIHDFESRGIETDFLSDSLVRKSLLGESVQFQLLTHISQIFLIINRKPANPNNIFGKYFACVNIEKRGCLQKINQIIIKLFFMI